MNKRIEELIEKAGLDCDECANLDPNLQEFAALVIKETLGVIFDGRQHAIAEFEISSRANIQKFILDTSCAAMGDTVKEHFGIKEWSC